MTIKITKTDLKRMLGQLESENLHNPNSLDVILIEKEEESMLLGEGDCLKAYSINRHTGNNENLLFEVVN